MKFHLHHIFRFIILTTTLLPFALHADRYTDYIEQYCDMAVAQQEEYGIPASITLAQGLLESAAGHSTLAREGHNHFGIKCHADWTGPTMLRNDDAPDECFRVYEDASGSYADHSRFLCRRRYQPLFENEVTDYTAWARGLSACGYATDPNYADRLISIIERYNLYCYDTPEGRRGEDVATFILEHLQKKHVVRRAQGLHYVVASPGDTYATIAAEFGMDAARLMRFNDAATDSGIKVWEEVYLEEKRATLTDGPRTATIGEDESIHSLSQRFGIKMATLTALNPTAKDKAGERLRLR